LTAAIREANAAILDRAAGDPGLWGMGTTGTAAALAGERHLQLAHVGDSRAYLLRDGSLEQLTTDHTVLVALVTRGPPPARPPRPAGPGRPPRPRGAARRRPGHALLRRPHRGGGRRPDRRAPVGRRGRRGGLPVPDRRRHRRRRPRQHHRGPPPGRLSVGIALRPVAEAERRLAEKGAIRLSALVMSEHDPAVALWVAAGYAHDPRVGRFVRSLRSGAGP